VGLGFESVPFQFGWDLVEWNSKLDKNPVDLGVKLDEYVEIYDEVEEEQPEVCGPQIELDLGTKSSIHDLGEPPMEAVEEVHEVVDIWDTFEEGKCDVEMRTGDMPIPRVKAGDSIFEDYLEDAFEKVREINLEETLQIPFEPVLTVPSDETPTIGEPRRKRIKTLVGHTDLPWVRKMLTQQIQTSPSTHQSSPKQPTQPTCKSHRLAAQGFVRRSSSTKQGPPVIEEIVSSSEGSPTKNPETPIKSHVSPVLTSE